MSDAGGSIASPLTVLDAEAVSKVTPVLDLIAEYAIALIVVGLPLTMAGDEGPQSARVREVAGELARRVPIPLVYYDERLSSAQASRAMRSAGTSSKRARGQVDKVAAALFLQSYLDSRPPEIQEHGRGTE